MPFRLKIHFADFQGKAVLPFVALVLLPQSLFAEPSITRVSSFTDGDRVSFSLGLSDADDVREILVSAKSRNGEKAFSLSPGSRFEFRNVEPVKNGIQYVFSFTPILRDGSPAEAKKLTRGFMPENLETGLPVMEVITGDCVWPESKPARSPAGAFSITANDYVKGSRIRFVDKDGIVIYDGGADARDAIKIRGNTSALNPKKPYKIKLGREADLLSPIIGDGRDRSARKWVLLAKGDSLREAIGFAASEYMGMDYTPSYAYIDLVMNGDWQGTYVLCEEVSRGDCRVWVAEGGFLVENDFYFWNEPVSFRTRVQEGYNFAWTLKYPDSDDAGEDDIDCIRDCISGFEDALDAGDDSYRDYIDEDTFARWLLVHDFLHTSDAAGGNMFLVKRDGSGSSRLRMTAPWDFDHSLNRVEGFSAIRSSGFFYFPRLLEKEGFSRAYKQLFAEKKDGFVGFALSKLSALDAEAIDRSRRHDEVRWRDSRSKVGAQIRNFTRFMEKRIAWMEENIGVPGD